MKQELQELLEKNYHFMNRNNAATENQGLDRNIYQLYGCECGDGWYQLLNDLCKDIISIYNHEEIEVDILILQIKEKFGTLRFYYTTTNSESNSVYIDILGDVTLRYSHEKRKIDKEVRRIVDYYCTKSASVCEMCGENAAVLRKDLPWVQTLCDSCYSSMKKNEIR